LNKAHDWLNCQLYAQLFYIRENDRKDNPVTKEEFLKLRFYSTFDLIEAINQRQKQNTTNQQKEDSHCDERV